MRALPEIKEHVPALKAAAGKLMGNLSREALTDDENPMPDQIKEWLAKLTLLYGVPFEHIAANSTMLPEESIRFFYVDPNWTNALMDGALSIGVQSSKDLLIQVAVNEPSRRSVKAAQHTVRRKLAKAELPEEVDVQPMAGLLMRSELVAGWPGMEILPYEDTAGTQIITILRMDRISPDVMLCLFAKVPAKIIIREPKETLCFGVTGGLAGTGMLARFLGAKPEQPVATFVPAEPPNYVKAVLRDSTLNVLDVVATRNLFRDVLVRYDALRSGTTNLSPADFAIQMVKVPEEQTFLSGQATGAHDCTDNG